MRQILDEILEQDACPKAAFSCGCSACSGSAHAVAEYDGEVLGETSNNSGASAVAYNRSAAQRLGWGAYRDRIVTQLLRLPTGADEGSFASAVARWQAAQGLAADGFLGPGTWASMKKSLSLGGGITPASGNALYATETQPPLRTYYANINLGISGVAPITGIYVPPAFRGETTLEIIVWLHGHSSTGSIARYWKQAHFPMREAVLQSGRNCILVAPTLGSKSQAGSLLRPGGFDQFINLIMQKLVAEGVVHSQTTIHNIVLACHSGGGSPMLRIASLDDQASQRITACWGYDCSYNSGSGERWAQWAASRPAARIFFYYRPRTGTAAQAEKLACLAQTAQNVYVFPSKMGHNELVLPYWKERLVNQAVPRLNQQICGSRRLSRELFGEDDEYELDYETEQWERAVRYNRSSAASMGWGPHAQTIAQKLLRLSDALNEHLFAEKVAEWQAANGLSADGKLGEKTWAKMRPLLGLSAPTTAMGADPGLSSNCPNSPGKWARDYFKPKLWPWWNDQNLVRRKGPEHAPIGSSIRQMIPLVFPGVPPEVMLGFCANGSLRGNTTEALSSQRFHEIGLFGTEAGLRDGPAPNPRPDAEYNSWGKLHRHPLVVKLLGGRLATMAHNAWKNAVSDQVAVGLVNLRRHGETVAQQLDPSIRPNIASSNLSLFFVACAFMAWSAGAAGAAKHLNRFAPLMARYPESQRWGAFLKILAEQISNGKINLSGLRKHRSPAHSALRTWQKIAGGQLLAANTGGNLRWFDTGLGSEEERVADIITCAARRAVS